jgi:hypothetical protein
MIRIEIKTEHKSFVSCESTPAEAKAYVQSLVDNGVVIISAEYFDLDSRVSDIRAGRV